ncbi:MAG: phosphoribosyltransferase domain-containing protein [Clostridia bacterium]|nr:phosphoribosyltransferase domain-containing protein [Clostridia bacterium]
MEINVKENQYDLDLRDLIYIGKRVNNSKRNFLFISKLLGKHVEVKPNICKATGRLLLSRVYDEVDYKLLCDYISRKEEACEEKVSVEISKEIDPGKRIFVIGFAETATGLGMSVAAPLKNAYYQTTTREPLIGVKKLFSFKEEHSHATNHDFYSVDETNINEYDEIYLVDDEITTGKSMLNIIAQLSKISSIKKFSIFSILDWRSEENLECYKRVEKECNVTIHVHSLISGTVLNDDQTIYTDDLDITYLDDAEIIGDASDAFEQVLLNTKFGERDYIRYSGRFGVCHQEILGLEEKCRQVAERIKVSKESRVLVLGHGEEIYIPSRIASYIDADVYFKTTTRSPIYCDGRVICDKTAFVNEGVTYFLYNKNEMEHDYDLVIIISESDIFKQFTENTVCLKI